MSKIDVYEIVTERILEQLDKGIVPWKKPWTASGGGAISRQTGKPYQFTNQLLLEPGEYCTFNQCKKEGGKVNKGAHGHVVVYWNLIKKTVEDDAGEMNVRTFPLLRYYKVFNINDTSLEPKYFGKEPKGGAKEVPEAAELIKQYEDREHIKVEDDGGDRAFYRPSTDEIHVPAIKQFSETAEYYSTVFHECIHSTGHSKRLNRDGVQGVAAFGSETYSKEELIAEIGAASLVGYAELETADSFKNSVSYIDNWRRAISEDKKLVVSAASKAEKAYKYFLTGEKNEYK